MSCRATLHSTGEESIPLLLVRDGILSPRQCDHEFKGLTGECPTCKAMIERADLGDGSSYAQAMLSLKQRGQRVTYRRFSYGSDGGVEPWRVCYWGHGPGYWDGVQFRDCQNPSTNAHAVHLAVIKRYYEKTFNPKEGFTIKVEQRLRKPGDPPQLYSPDLALYGPKGEPMVAVEYQRSFESYDDFCRRDDLRRSEDWSVIDWWFDDTQDKPEEKRQTVYSRSQMHRTHLALLGVPFYRCWVDPHTFKLEADFGTCGDLPPSRKKRVERKLEKADLAECSTAQIMRQIEEGPEREIIKDFIKPLEALPGSDLNFRERFNYNAERERRMALAVVTRQTRLEEQDRRHREWVAEQQRLEAEKREQERVAEEKRQQLRDQMQRRIEMRSFIRQQFRAGHPFLARLDHLNDEDLEEIYEEAQRVKAEKDVEIAKQEVKRRAEQEAVEAAYRAEQQRLADERQAQWERDNAERLERERQHQEAELHWHPIEFSEPKGKQGYRMTMNLMIGDKIRPYPGKAGETYQGRNAAGFSTDNHTYSELKGWEVWKKLKRAS